MIKHIVKIRKIGKYQNKDRLIDINWKKVYNIVGNLETLNSEKNGRLRTMSEKASLDHWKKEYNFIKGYATMYKMRNTLIALTLALKYHDGQYRDGGEPYIIHPLLVCKSLILLNIEKCLEEWYPDRNIYQIRHQCDVMYAAAILHDVIEDCKLPNKGRELVEIYNLDKEVWQIVWLLTKPPKVKKWPWSPVYDPEKYFGNIKMDWKATLIKIADRANNCSTMQVFDEQRKRKYILETIQYIYPLCSEGKIRYPEFSDAISILKNLIVSVCETLASLLGMQEVISDEAEEYKKTVHFIEGMSRNEMPNTYKALAIAQKFHEGQTRTSGDPFVIHPIRVCSYLMTLGVHDDYTCAAALLHEIPQMCHTSGNGEEFSKDYDIEEEVIDVVKLVANKNKPLEKYYADIEVNPRALLEKLSNRVHTCTFLAKASKQDMVDYIAETKEYMVPMCKYGMLHYPEYADKIEIMQSHILAICNILDVVTKQKTGLTSQRS